MVKLFAHHVLCRRTFNRHIRSCIVCPALLATVSLCWLRNGCDCHFSIDLMVQLWHLSLFIIIAFQCQFSTFKVMFVCHLTGFIHFNF